MPALDLSLVRNPALALIAAACLAALGACTSHASDANAPATAAASAAVSATAGNPVPKASAAAAALPVTVAVARKQEVSRVLEVDATLASLSSPVIAAEVSARVQRVLVRPGQPVKRGQLLAALDDADLALSAADARAQTAAVQTQLAQKSQDAARAETLFAKEYVSAASLEAARSELAAAQAQVQASRARLALAERVRAKASVVAPFDATVVAVQASPGAFARAGDALVTLWSPDVSVLELHIPQENLGQVRVGQAVSLRWGGQTAQSTITRVGQAVNPASRSFDAHADVPTALAGVSGLGLRAGIALDKRTRLVVPAGAPQLAGDDAYVIVEREGRAHRVAVRLGPQADGAVEVLSGLEEGERVVVDGAAFAREGQRLQVKEVLE